MTVKSYGRGIWIFVLLTAASVAAPADGIRTMEYSRGAESEALVWQQSVRAELFSLLELDDLLRLKDSLPFNERVIAATDHGGYTERELEIQSTPGRRIRILLAAPNTDRRGLPAAVCIHGHGGNRRAVYDRGSIYKGFAAELAERGYVTISADVGQHEVYEEGRTLMGERLWDLIRCVDYASSLPQVNPSRIGCAGLSLGGEMAMWLAAMDERVTATVSSGFLTVMDQMEQNHCMCWKFDGLRELVDFADIYSLTAPRALQCQNGLSEGPTQFYVPVARRAFAEIRRIYEDMNQPGQVELDIHEGGHEIDLPALLAFFETRLPRPIGKIRPLHAREIESSNWSAGAETMDRDYTVYENWSEHLGPLGVKKARLQSGWAKTERAAGVYDWNWLDAIIQDMRAQGVEPWMCLCYGNTVYQGGGGTRLGAAIPVSPEARAAWLRFVRGIVARYKDAIDEWEVWNEPNHGGNAPEVYADFLVDTARAVRSIQPDATIVSMSLAGVDVQYASDVLRILSDRDHLHLVDEISYHPYSKNPDDSYRAVARLREAVAGFSPRLSIRQGENGAPSEYRETKALSRYPWTETSQAKWALRRMLGDLGRGIPSSYFAIMDMNYPDEINRKGLLRANGDQTVQRRKPAYYAVQHLAAVFTDRLEGVPGLAWETSTSRSLSLFAFENPHSGKSAAVFWFDGEIPSDSPAVYPVDIVLYGADFERPVFADLASGGIYPIPAGSWSRAGNVHRFSGAPCLDSPVMIADESLIPMVRYEPVSSK